MIESDIPLKGKGLYVDARTSAYITTDEDRIVQIARVAVDTGLRGNVMSAIISSFARRTGWTILLDGTLWIDYNGLKKFPATPSGPPVQFADGYEYIPRDDYTNYVFAESTDGKLWISYWSAYDDDISDKWTSVTGFPTPVRDWYLSTSNDGGIYLSVIGGDGNLYFGKREGIIGFKISSGRTEDAAWSPGSLIRFVKTGKSATVVSSAAGFLFIDNKGEIYKENAQGLQLGGDLTGKLNDITALHQPRLFVTDDAGDEPVYAIDNGRLYILDVQYNSPFKEITPQSL